jgi:hypothetical protein
LNKLIKNVHQDSIELKVKLQSPELLSPDTPDKVAEESLKMFQETIDKLIGKARNYSSYQERFGNTMKQVKKKTNQM